MRAPQKRALVMPSFVLGVAVLLGAIPAGATNSALKEVMKKMGASTAAGDTKTLAPIFIQTKSAKPADPSFDGWNEIAEKGRAAAEKDDLAGAKATCKDCHEKFRESYRSKYGSKAP